ncbi:kinase-like domain-containing protein [Terfezia claveryi]|nr:kinase-like domain-containing protein [Terfezia claveryi]
MKKIKIEKDVQTEAVTISEAVPPQQPAINNGIPSPHISIPTPLSPLSPQEHDQDVVNGKGAELEGRDTDHKNVPEHQQVPPAEAFVDPVIGRTLHARYHIFGALGQPEPPDADNHLDPRGRRTGTLVAVKRVNSPWLNPWPIFAFFDQEYIFHLVLEPLDSARPVSLPERCACVPSRIQKCKSTLACPGRQYLFQKLVVQLLSGVHALHRHGLIHSDLTPANILYLPESNRIKIIDLGNAIKIDDPPLEGEAQFEVQSAHYRAPEILLGAGPLERKIDVWGVGVVGLEWLLGTEGVDINTVWQPIMAVSTPSRKALVARITTLFGSVGSYRQGVFWREEYDTLGRMPGGIAEVDEWGLAVSQENHAILPRFLLNTTLSPGLTQCMGKMLQVDVWKRKTSAEVLRDEWLVKGLLGEWASVLLSDAPIYHRVGMAREDVREGTAESGEEVWVEEIDDSGFAESVDGKEMEADGRGQWVKGITPTDSPVEEDTREEPSHNHHRDYTVTTPEEDLCGNLYHEANLTPTSESPTGDKVPRSSKQFAPSTPFQKIKGVKRFDDIPFGDGLPFPSPTDFPFTYTRFCPSPSPPLPRLFQSPSPEPLPPPSPGQLAQAEVEEDVDVLLLRPMGLATDLDVTVRRNSIEQAAHVTRQQLQWEIHPNLAPLVVDGLASLQGSPRPLTTLNDTPEVLPQKQAPILLNEDNEIKEPNIIIWHMDLARGLQVVFLCHSYLSDILIANQVNRGAIRMMRMMTKFVCYNSVYFGLPILFQHTIYFLLIK